MKYFVLLLLAAICGVKATSVTVDVNVGCDVNPNYGATTLSVFTSANCRGTNGGPIGDTFYFQGVSDGLKSCQGPTIWYTYAPPDESSNETLPQITTKNIWVKTNAVLQTDPPCSALATFNFYSDQACSAPYNLVLSGPAVFGLQGIEDPSNCANRTNSPYGSADWRAEIGSYTISAATDIRASPTIILIALAAATLARFTQH